MLEEKNKVSVLQESLRVKDQNMRRAETELDSVNFRNKQLEHRVSIIQDDLQKLSKGGNSKSNKLRDNQGTDNGQMDPIIVEELQKRIMENAFLASTVRRKKLEKKICSAFKSSHFLQISDKNNEIEMYTNRIKDLEIQFSKHIQEHSDVERKLRRELEMISSRTIDLESKITEATSQIGSEGDGVSLASDTTLPLHMVLPNTSDERIAFLEKELNHYRTQYELMKINEALRMDETLMTQQSTIQQTAQPRNVLSSQSSTSSSMSNNNNHSTFVNYPTSSQSSGSKSSPSQNSKR